MWARQPVSRVLCRSGEPERGGHSSGPLLAERFSRPTRTTRSCDTPAPDTHAGRASSLFGLAPGGACHAVPVAGGAVRSYRTVSPLPHALLTREGRSVLCGAFPGIAPGGRYPPPCRRGARTFLPLRRGSDRPAVWPGSQMGCRGCAVKHQRVASDGRPIESEPRLLPARHPAVRRACLRHPPGGAGQHCFASSPASPPVEAKGRHLGTLQHSIDEVMDGDEMEAAGPPLSSG